MGRGREAWVLVVLLVVFVAGAAAIQRHSVQEDEQRRPSAYAYGRTGLRAAYELVRRQGVRVMRHEAPLTRLPDSTGLLVVAEPMVREMGHQETRHVWSWVERGGTLLVLVSGDLLVREPGGLVADRVRVDRSPGPATEVRADESVSPLLRDVRLLCVDGPARLEPRQPGGRVVVRDSRGGLLVAWRAGKGMALFASDALGLHNAALGRGDAPVLLANIAAAGTSRSRAAAFDEYHQGHGRQEAAARSLWVAIGMPGRALAWHGLALFALLVFAANRPLGRRQPLPRAKHRPITEHVVAMAGLYRRAGAGGAALEILLRAFLRDLARRLDCPDSSPAVLAWEAARRLGWHEAATADLLARCQEAAARHPLDPAELLRLGRELDTLRTKADLGRSH